MPDLETMREICSLIIKAGFPATAEITAFNETWNGYSFEIAERAIASFDRDTRVLTIEYWATGIWVDEDPIRIASYKVS